jgi:hypothetical protein
MDSVKYQETLQTQMLPHGNEKMPARWIFQHDNDPKHIEIRTIVITLHWINFEGQIIDITGVISSGWVQSPLLPTKLFKNKSHRFIHHTLIPSYPHTLIPSFPHTLIMTCKSTKKLSISNKNQFQLVGGWSCLLQGVRKSAATECSRVQQLFFIHNRFHGVDPAAFSARPSM